MLKDRLIFGADLEKDSLRFYYLWPNWRHRVEHFGAKATGIMKPFGCFDIDNREPKANMILPEGLQDKITRFKL